MVDANQGTLCIPPCCLWLRGLGRSAALFFLAMRGYWLQKDALRPIPIRVPQFRQSYAEGP